MKIKANLVETKQLFKANVSVGDLLLPADFGEIQTVTKYVGGEPYEGDYSVTPKVTAQTMPTKEKVMLEDLTINSIPLYSVSNNSGGNTIYIGKEI